MSLKDLQAKSFSETDKENLISLLNLTHLHITGLDGKKAFEYFKLMSWAQQQFLPKVNSHIMGEVKVHETPAEEKPKTKSKKASK